MEIFNSKPFPTSKMSHIYTKNKFQLQNSTSFPNSLISLLVSNSNSPTLLENPVILNFKQITTKMNFCLR
jgi:hypothetical protein